MKPTLFLIVFHTIVDLEEGIIIGILLDLLTLAVYIPFLQVDEEEIGRNVKRLKKYQWFQTYLNDEKYRELIIHNKEVRQAIGQFHSNRIDKDSYNSRCQKRLHKVLLKQLNQAV